METPRNKAGEMTERIMAQAQVNLDNRHAEKLSTSQYNAIYSAVYNVLSEAQP